MLDGKRDCREGQRLIMVRAGEKGESKFFFKKKHRYICVSDIILYYVT